MTVLMWLHTQKARAKVANLCSWSGNIESKNLPHSHDAPISYSRDAALQSSTKSLLCQHQKTLNHQVKLSENTISKHSLVMMNN